MARDSRGTQFSFDNTRPAEPVAEANSPTSSDTAPQSTYELHPAVPIRDVADGLEKKRKRLVEDEGKASLRLTTGTVLQAPT